jgi:hypothetical protein
MPGLYSLYWYDPAGTQHTEFRHQPISSVKSALDRLTKGPGAMVVKEIKVTDALDFLCLHIVDGHPVDEQGTPLPPQSAPATGQ